MTWVFVDPDELDDVARQLRGIAATLDRVPGMVHRCCGCAVSCSIGGHAQQVQSNTGYAIRSAADNMLFHASDLDRRVGLARQALGTAYTAAVSPAVPFTAASATSGPGVTSATATPALRQLLYPTSTSIGGNAAPGWSIVATPSTVPAAVYGSTMTIGGNTGPGFAILPGTSGTTAPLSGGFTTLGGNAGGFAMLPSTASLAPGWSAAEMAPSWSSGNDLSLVDRSGATVATGGFGSFNLPAVAPRPAPPTSVLDSTLNTISLNMPVDNPFGSGTMPLLGASLTTGVESNSVLLGAL